MDVTVLLVVSGIRPSLRRLSNKDNGSTGENTGAGLRVRDDDEVVSGVDGGGATYDVVVVDGVNGIGATYMEDDEEEVESGALYVDDSTRLGL